MTWEATPEVCFTKFAVVQREGERTTRLIAEDLEREEAALIANSRRMRDCLEELLNAALEEELPTDAVRQRAMRVFLAAQGIETEKRKGGTRLIALGPGAL